MVPQADENGTPVGDLDWVKHHFPKALDGGVFGWDEMLLSYHVSFIEDDESDEDMPHLVVNTGMNALVNNVEFGGSGNHRHDNHASDPTNHRRATQSGAHHDNGLAQRRLSNFSPGLLSPHTNFV